MKEKNCHTVMLMTLQRSQIFLLLSSLQISWANTSFQPVKMSHWLIDWLVNKRNITTRWCHEDKPSEKICVRVVKDLKLERLNHWEESAKAIYYTRRQKVAQALIVLFSAHLIWLEKIHLRTYLDFWKNFWSARSIFDQQEACNGLSWMWDAQWCEC